MTKTVNNPAEVRLHRKLAIAEAKADMWQEQANGLSVKLAEALAKIETDKAYFEANYKQAKSETTTVTAKLTAEREVNNQLRGIIHDLELTNARQNGYIDGVEESLPPRMVEERRSLRRMEATPVDVFSPMAVVGSRHGSSKPWFVR